MTLKGKSNSKKRKTAAKKHALKSLDTFPDALFEPLPEEFRGENYHNFNNLSLKKIRLALLYVKAGYTFDELCKMIKISKSTLTLWAANSPENRALLEECFDSRIVTAEDKLFQNVKKGDQRAIEFMLERRSPRFKKDQADVTINLTNQQIIDDVNQKFGITLDVDAEDVADDDE